ncbi:Non-symbiotic hemoglobin [Trichinella spiralis]|uniref:Non-symbiotic hemoglobin n=1 Tax=Trichinella spiralis TaxID=6334 RepID=A0ABR3K4H1_TRISP
MSAVTGSFDGFSRATGNSESLLEAKAERKEASENIAAVAAWENDEKEGQRRLDQITAAMESTDFTVALQRNRLILKIQRAEKTAEALRRWCDDSQLSRESRIRLEELSTALCLRFARNCRSAAGERRSGPLTVQELDAAEQNWVRIAQGQGFR